MSAKSKTDPTASIADATNARSAFALVDLSLYNVGNNDIAALIDEYPLAWLMPCCANAAQPHLLPLLAECDEHGLLTTLLGHMGRRNPLVSAFQESPEALILFTGPQGYVSTACVGRRSWAPTWNYAQLRIEAKVRLEPDQGDAALLALVEKMDAAEQTGWRPRDVGERYRVMEQAIIAFRAEVTRIEPRFKLAQDESIETLREILANHPDPALVSWMKRVNRHRL